MLHSKIFKGTKLNIYTVCLTVVLSIIALTPLFFYWSKCTKNPREFMVPERRYLAIELKIFDISPEYLAAIEVDDSETDNNGEEITKIISILKVEPRSLGKFTSDGIKYTDIISANSDVCILLKVRYQDIMGRLMPYSTSDVELKAGNFFSLKITKNILLSGKIIKVDSYR